MIRSFTKSEETYEGSYNQIKNGSQAQIHGLSRFRWTSWRLFGPFESDSRTLVDH